MRCHVVADIGLNKESIKKYKEKLPALQEKKCMNARIRNMELDIYRCIASKEHAADNAIFVNEYKASTEADVEDTVTEQNNTATEQDGQYYLLTEDILQLLQPAGQSTETALGIL